LLDELSKDPSQAPVATHLRAHMRYGQGRYDEAGELLQSLIDFGVRLPQLHTEMGRIHIRRGGWQDAETSYRQAIEIDADDADAHDGLGLALREQGRAEEAVYEHMKAIALALQAGGRPQSHINLGIALADCKQVDWAIRAFQTAIELAPENPFPHRCLAQIYRKARKDEETARRHLRTAVELRARLQQRSREEFLERDTWM
jgi:Flp pilus assembly protein TadD